MKSGMRTVGMLAGLFLAMPLWAGWAEMQIERTVKNVASVRSYHGVLEQGGLFGNEKVHSEIWFQRAHDFHAQVTAPASLAGSVMRYTDETLLTWVPMLDIAVVIRNLPAAPADKEKQRIADVWRENTRRYFYGLGPVSRVAGYETIELEQRARQPSDLMQSSKTRVFDRYSFPLEGQVNMQGGARFDYVYRSIRFNEALTLPEAPALPASAMVVEWDLAWENRRTDELVARLPALQNMPERMAGMPLKRALIHPGALPAVAGFYSDDNYFVLLTAARDFALPNPAPYGVKLPLVDNVQGLMVPGPVVTGWSFTASGVSWTVLSNQHPETLYREIRQLLTP